MNPFVGGLRGSSFAELYSNDEARILAGVERCRIASDNSPNPPLKLIKIAMVAPTKLGS